MKFLFLLITLLLSSFSTFSQTSLLSQAYAYYPLGNTCNDFAGNGLNLVCSNVDSSAGYYTSGSGSSSFNGIDSKISRPHLVLGDTFAFSGWFYSKSNFQSCNLIYNGNSGSNGYGLFLKKPFGTALGNKIICVQGGVSENLLDTSISMPLNQWTHLVMMVYKNNFYVFINGTLRGTGIRGVNSPNGEFALGQNQQQIQGGFPAFNGDIDDVCIFKKKITTATVQQLYNEGFVTHTSNKFKSIKPSFKTSEGEISVFTTGILEGIELLDLSGRNIQTVPQGNLSTESGNQYRFKIGAIPSGIYLLKGQVGGVPFAGKVVY